MSESTSWESPEAQAELLKIISMLWPTHARIKNLKKQEKSCTVTMQQEQLQPTKVRAKTKKKLPLLSTTTLSLERDRPWPPGGYSFPKDIRPRQPAWPNVLHLGRNITSGSRFPLHMSIDSSCQIYQMKGEKSSETIITVVVETIFERRPSLTN